MAGNYSLEAIFKALMEAPFRRYWQKECPMSMMRHLLKLLRMLPIIYKHVERSSAPYLDPQINAIPLLYPRKQCTNILRIILYIHDASRSEISAFELGLMLCYHLNICDIVSKADSLLVVDWITKISSHLPTLKSKTFTRDV